MLMYNLIEYSDNYSKTFIQSFIQSMTQSIIIHNYYKNVQSNTLTDSKSFKFKLHFTSCTNSEGTKMHE